MSLKQVSHQSYVHVAYTDPHKVISRQTSEIRHIMSHKFSFTAH